MVQGIALIIQWMKTIKSYVIGCSSETQISDEASIL